MIRMRVQQADDGKWTVNEADGRNGRTLLSSTSQGYDRRAKAEAIARRVAPAGNELVELVVTDRAGAVLLRETLHHGEAGAL
ncbi:hypothetical protein LV457_02720 [Mycobacterium sp. MYCO198283]|uniref:hypothetical protein n=1 Tax=Mycobacterium sp. MYCO198283 TaxID=2883505 RepID=UPI001E399834|nr:hypothetical protein [Mycobacterium sp. MYCO198283]MCG5431203.1 hypothetical protein [Mycobacterium sp. MYCO198283]